MSGGNDRVRTATCSALRRTDLGDHPATADVAADAACHLVELGVAGVGLRYQRRLCMLAWIAVEQTRLICEDHQRIGFHEIGHQRGKRIVVAELDLLDRYRVVL